MSRRFGVWLLLMLACNCALADGGPYNVVLVMTDDQGYGDLSLHGNEHLETPRLDTFARSAASLQRFYVSPVCAPTRASLLTGRYYLRTGVHGVTRGRETMRAAEFTLAELFRAAGYRTGCFGKWHNGAHFPHDPLGQGFDEFVGFCGGHLNNYFDPLLRFGHTFRRARGFITDVLTDEAIEFIRRHKRQPFFCYVPYNAPHSPFQAPDSLFTKYKQQGLDDRLACIYAMCENIDHNFGRLLDELRNLNLADNTVVVFLTDNGPNSNRFNTGFAGRKASVREGGVRVPCFISIPAASARQLNAGALAADIDLFALLAHVSGAENQVADAAWRTALDSDAGGLLGESSESRYVFSHHTPALAPVSRFPAAVRSARFTALNLGGAWQLFGQDPTSRAPRGGNIADQHPSELQSLQQAFDNWFAEVTSAGFQRIPIEVGHRQAPRVQLPAHEADIVAGADGVKYCDGKGWCNAWVSVSAGTEAQMVWPLKLVSSGDYTVRARLALPPEWIGGAIRIELAGQTIGWPIKRSIPFAGVENQDRVPRTEATERNWQEVELGKVRLEEGTCELRMTASPPRISAGGGSTSVDIKSAILVKK